MCFVRTLLKMENWKIGRPLNSWNEKWCNKVLKWSGVGCCGNGWPCLLPVTDWLFLEQPPIYYKVTPTNQRWWWQRIIKHHGDHNCHDYQDDHKCQDYHDHQDLCLWLPPPALIVLLLILIMMMILLIEIFDFLHLPLITLQSTGGQCWVSQSFLSFSSTPSPSLSSSSPRSLSLS